jgi:aryl-alcohol dehydrogenase-like predicted oxidoreductase
MFTGFANAEGTARFAGRFSGPKSAGFYRQVQGLTVSSIGIGTYLGACDRDTDVSYTQAVESALTKGLNFIDTSLNYRNQLSERSIGAALSDLIQRKAIARDEIVVCTKAGYLVPNAVPEGVLKPEDIVGGMHAMTPAFLADQLERSRQNLGLATLDVLYLHNPETQLGYVSADTFYTRVRDAFAFLETKVGEGAIRFYGMATWDGFRIQGGANGALSLTRAAQIANEIAGEQHHFRFIQLPFNFAMPEAFIQRVDGKNVLSLARELGITVVASASLLQARLASGIPDHIAAKFPGTATDAQRSIQFTRSTPGISVALIGMSKAEHVRENLGLANTPPMNEPQYLNVYKQE